MLRSLLLHLIFRCSLHLLPLHCQSMSFRLVRRHSRLLFRCLLGYLRSLHCGSLPHRRHCFLLFRASLSRFPHSHVFLCILPCGCCGGLLGVSFLGSFDHVSFLRCFLHHFLHRGNAFHHLGS